MAAFCFMLSQSKIKTCWFFVPFSTLFTSSTQQFMDLLSWIYCFNYSKFEIRSQRERRKTLSQLWDKTSPHWKSFRVLWETREKFQFSICPPLLFLFSNKFPPPLKIFQLQGKSFIRLRQTCHGIDQFVKTHRKISVQLDGIYDVKKNKNGTVYLKAEDDFVPRGIYAVRLESLYLNSSI